MVYGRDVSNKPGTCGVRHVMKRVNIGALLTHCLEVTTHWVTKRFNCLSQSRGMVFSESISAFSAFKGRTYGMMALAFMRPTEIDLGKFTWSRNECVEKLT